MSSSQNLALLARFREDVRRSRQALEAIAAAGEVLAATEANTPAMVQIEQTSHERPAEAIARSMIAYLDQGGRLEPDVALELSNSLTACRARRRTDDAP